MWEAVSENNTGEVCTTEHSNLDRFTAKAETVAEKEQESDISYAEVDIKLPDIKTECLENSERFHQTSGGKTYYYCTVPMCKNTSITAPEKQFIAVPRNPVLRKKWCNAMKRCDKQNSLLSPNSARYCCEDHFDLPNDMGNFMKHKIMGLGNRTLKAKKEVLPHIFECQGASPITQRLTGARRHRLEIFGEVSPRSFCSGVGSTMVKLEPGTSAAEGVAVMLTDIKIELHRNFIKNEYLEAVSENSAGEICTTEHSNLDRVIVKAETGTEQEQESDISYTHVDVELPDIKAENFKNSESFHQSSSGACGLKNIHQKCSGKESNNSRSFPCSMCDRKLASKTSLMAHLRIHNQNKPFSCSYCSYSCSLKSYLTRHIRTHSKEKPFACAYCSHSCSEKSYLIKHIRTHTKEKPFCCSKCNYSSSYKSTLMRHMHTHTKEKLLPCSYCGYSCLQKSNLIRHMHTHTKE